MVMRIGKKFPLTSKDYKGARLRHAFKEGNDEDTGLDHLAHEAVNCMFEYWHKYMKYVANPLPTKNEFHNEWMNHIHIIDLHLKKFMELV